MAKDSVRIKTFTAKILTDDQKQPDEAHLWPKISIITPSFNQEKFLERTILSVLNQHYPNLEYILFDGGSIDESIKIIVKYEKYLSCWKSEPDQGQADAITKGFKIATGEIFAWLNSDDVYCPGCLNYVGQYFLKHPEIDVLYGDSLRIDEDDNILREVRSVKFSKHAFLTASFSLHQASMFWRKGVYLKTDGLNKSLNLTLDPDLWQQFYEQGAHFEHVRKILACYREHSRSKTFLYLDDIHRLRKQHLRERFGINTECLKFRTMEKLMRLRTLFLHLLTGNFCYLWKYAGKK